jgi:hypothetical protein
MQILHGTARQVGSSQVGGFQPGGWVSAGWVGFGRVGVGSGRADQPTVSTGSIVTSESRPVVTQ